MLVVFRKCVGSRYAAVVAPILILLPVSLAFGAVDYSTYRGISLGTNLEKGATQAGTKPTAARQVYQRPALIQELDWQPPQYASETPAQAETVRDGILSFLDGQLFRIVVNYDRYRIEGMTADDMVQGISALYGAATTPTASIAYHSVYGETAPVLARWEDADYSWNLVRTGDRSSYSLVVYSKKLDAQAQAAIVESNRLDVQEAPQRELARQKQRDDEDQKALDKARLQNRPGFRP